MKKLFSVLLVLSFSILFGCSEKEPPSPAPLSSSYSARIRISIGKSEYGAEISGIDKMKIISPQALSALEFRNENGIAVAQYGKQIISQEQSNVPLKDLFISLSSMLKMIGTSEYEFSKEKIIYSADGCILEVNPESGLPLSFTGKECLVEFI